MLITAAVSGVAPMEWVGRSEATTQRHELDLSLCKLAAAVFELDSPGSVEHELYRNASTTWRPGCALLADSVATALGRQKQASVLLPVLAATHDKLGGKLLRTLVAAGVLGGAGVGSLGYLLSRNARQSSAENAETLEKARTYRQLARDIREDMAMTERETKPTKSRYHV